MYIYFMRLFCPSLICWTCTLHRGVSATSRHMQLLQLQPASEHTCLCVGCLQARKKPPSLPSLLRSFTGVPRIEGASVIVLLILETVLGRSELDGKMLKWSEKGSLLNMSPLLLILLGRTLDGARGMKIIKQKH